VPVRVTLLDRHNHHVFSAAAYKKVATATLSPGDIASPIRWILRRARNVARPLGDRPRDRYTDSARPAGDDSTIDYDYLIVATGASHTYFGTTDEDDCGNRSARDVEEQPRRARRCGPRTGGHGYRQCRAATEIRHAPLSLW